MPPLRATYRGEKFSRWIEKEVIFMGMIERHGQTNGHGRNNNRLFALSTTQNLSPKARYFNQVHWLSADTLVTGTGIGR